MTPPYSRDRIEEKLISLFAGEAGVSRQRIDLEAPIAGYGLDSVAIASVLGDLETWSGRRIDPGLMWKQPSIRALAEHLSQPLSTERAPSPDNRYDAVSGLPEFEARFGALSETEVEDPFFRLFEGV